MRKIRRVVAFVLLASGLLPVALSAQRRADFRIVVLEGEDSTNIIQQRTAVVPVIEVRDKNDQPIAGALVRFAIRRGSAQFANGARSMIVTTDASGRAVGAGLHATRQGTLQLTVAARVQGQTISTTITQSNVVTAAQAASQAGQAASAAGGAAGGTGGGLSGVAIGGIVAGGAGGAVAALTVGRGDDSSASTNASTNATGGTGSSGPSGPAAPSGPVSRSYTTTFSIPFDQTITTANPGNTIVCNQAFNALGPLTLNLTIAPDGGITGTTNSITTSMVPAYAGCSGQYGFPWGSGGVVSGTRNALNVTVTFSAATNFGGPMEARWMLTFNGSVLTDTVAGTLTIVEDSNGTSDGSAGNTAGAPITIKGFGSGAITLQ